LGIFSKSRLATKENLLIKTKIIIPEEEIKISQRIISIIVKNICQKI